MPRRPGSTPATWLRALRSLRPKQWVHFLGLPAGALHPAMRPISWTRAAECTMIAAALLSYAYGLNAVTDRSIDSDVNKNPLSGVGPLPPKVYVVVAATALGALGIAIWAGRTALVATLLSLAASTVYSAGPRYKAWPVVGTLTNGLIFTPLLALGLDGATWPPAFVALVITFNTLLVQNQLLHEWADRADDRSGQVRTTAQLLSKRSLAGVVVALGLAGGAVVPFFAPNLAVARACQAALVLSALIAFVPVSASTMRVLHRVVAGTAGAAAFASQWLEV